MIVPVGERYQQMLYLFKKEDGKLKSEALRPTLFVPMTGKAEDQRQVKPDPLHPKLVNGSFEEVTGTAGEPAGWYYIRQMKVVTDKSRPRRQALRHLHERPSRAAAAGRCKASPSTAARCTRSNSRAKSAARASARVRRLTRCRRFP